MLSHKFGFGKKRQFVFTGNSRETILCELIRSASGHASTLNILARAEGKPVDDVTLHRLTSSVTDIRGQLFITLPLNFFETVSLTIPAMAEEAVSRALPYHLAKVIDKPLQNFIYDWQITQRLKDSLHVCAYLFPVRVYNKLDREFSRKQLEIKAFEPDVFSAFAYLEQFSRFSGDDVVLCVLIWPKFISQAVFEKGKLKLVRMVTVNQPETPFSEECLPAEVPETEESHKSGADRPEDIISPSLAQLQEEQAPSDQQQPDQDRGSSILDEFQLVSADEAVDAPSPSSDLPRPEPEPFAPPILNEWITYIDDINLEIIRTRDYYTTVQKGADVGKVFVGGAEDFFSSLRNIIRSSADIEIAGLSEQTPDQDMSMLQYAICIGSGSRW